MAEKVGTGKNYVLICDELFRGTNVQDAREATVMIIKAFSEVRKGFFLFSSHIIKAAEDLSNTKPNILFKSFAWRLNSENTITHSYQMEDGVSHNRFGNYIIKKKGITAILKSCK